MRFLGWIFAIVGLGWTTGCEQPEDDRGTVLRANQVVYSPLVDDCVVGVALDLDEQTATISTCNTVNRTIEVWVDLYDCADVRLSWSRVIVVSTNFDAEPFHGQWTFSHKGVDIRDEPAEACGLSWHFFETEEDDECWISYTGWVLESEIEPI